MLTPSWEKQREPFGIVSSLHENENSCASSVDGTNFVPHLEVVCAGEVSQNRVFEVASDVLERAGGKGGLVEDTAVDLLETGFDFTGNMAAGEVFPVGSVVC